MFGYYKIHAKVSQNIYHIRTIYQQLKFTTVNTKETSPSPLR